LHAQTVPERNSKSRMRERAPPPAAAPLGAVLEFEFLSGKMVGVQSMKKTCLGGSLKFVQARIARGRAAA
jgi:hypothetical protein